MLTFVPQSKYTRADVKERAGLPRDAKGGNWDTGIVEHDSEFVIFANVGSAGRTGHDYNNRWDGPDFRWFHKTKSRLDWPTVGQLLAEGNVIHLFWRTSNSQPFEYAGLASAIEVLDTSPVEILWALKDDPRAGDIFQGADEIGPGEYYEGAIYNVNVNRYERDRSARQACIDHYGIQCVTCGFNFEERYGSIGANYIHVHHLVPLSTIRVGYQIDPIKDLRPICPNCHAMLHSRRPPFSIDEILELLNET